MLFTGQASVGQECWSSANGVVTGGCASGTQCGPWLPNGGTWNGNDAWYCIKSGTNALADGASCNYDSKIGKYHLCFADLSQLSIYRLLLQWHML